MSINSEARIIALEECVTAISKVLSLVKMYAASEDAKMLMAKCHSSVAEVEKNLEEAKARMREEDGPGIFG